MSRSSPDIPSLPEPASSLPLTAPPFLAAVAAPPQAVLVSIWDFDLVRRQVTLDANWSRMIGGAAEPTTVGLRHMFALVHPEERAGAWQAVQNCFNGQTSDYHQEYRVKTGAGRWIWIQSRGRVVERDGGGRALRMTGTNTDITHHRQQAQATAGRLEFLATLNHTTLELLRHDDKSGVLQALAARAARMFGAAQVEVALVEGEELVTHAYGGSAPVRLLSRVSRAEAVLSWRAIDSRQPVVVDHYHHLATGSAPYQLAGFGSVAIFPILHGNRCRGVLALLRSDQVEAFSDEDRQKGVLLAQLASLVIHNAEIYEDARREAEKRTTEVRERERLYRSLVESINQGNYVADRRSLFTYCNPAMCAMGGYSRTELLGSSCFRLVAPEDRAAVVRQYREWIADRTATDRTCEFRVLAKDGRVFWVEQATHFLRDDAGVVIEGRNNLRDISERKAAADALRESEARFRSVFDESPIPVILLAGAGGEVREINKATTETFGYTREEAVGKTTQELGIWPDPAVREHLIGRLQAEGMVRGYEAIMRGKDGRVIHALYHASRIRIGEQHYLLSSVVDITQGRNTQEALRVSEARFRALSDVSPAGIFSTDAAGRTNFVNQRWCDIAGVPAAQALGDRWLQSVHPEDRDRLVAGWARAVADQAPSSAEFRCIRPDGRFSYLVGQSQPQRNADGVVTGHVGTVTDITSLRLAEEARQKAESQLRQSQKMESLGTLAGGIAHDFNNILTGMLGYAELGLTDTAVGHPAREWLEGIVRSGQRAKGLVQQILTFSRKTESTRSPVRVQQIAAETADLLRSTLPAMVRLERTLDPATLPVWGDATEIHQVILNLATNAWHALPESGGLIEIGVGPHDIAPEFAADHPPLGPGPHVRLTVRDNGAGMTAATLERIFEPFFTTKAVGKGTGLGLAVVHSVVNAHGGAITVHSTPGRGTRFELFLPALTASSPPAAGSGPAALPRGSGQRILVVDDEAISGGVVARLVGRLGYEATFCADPFRALDLLRAGGYDLVLTDLAMPGMPGDELARQALQGNPVLPVLLLSGFVEPAKYEQLRTLGVREILSKPPSSQELAMALFRALAG